jgi:hypothetical protein
MAMARNSAWVIVLLFVFAGPGFAPPPAIFKRGDVTVDGVLTVIDAVTLSNVLLIGNPIINANALPCKSAADVDDSNCINVADVAYLLSYLFSGGPAPPAPGPITCGPDTPGAPGGSCVPGGGAPNPNWDCNTYPSC